MKKFEKIKKLEYLVALQSDCSERGDWEDFDRLENSIEKLEKDLLKPKTE